jgi:hypothetical protein
MLAVPSPAIGGEREDLVELRKLAGLDTLFKNIGQLGDVGAEGIKDDRTREAWEAAAAESFVADAMREDALASLPGAMTDTERSALLAFYRSDFANKMLSLENAAQDGVDHVAEGKAVLAGATSERRELLQALAKATGNDVAKQLFIESLRSMMLAEVLAAAHGGSPIPWDEINRRIDAQIDLIAPTMMAQIQEISETTIAYTYRDLSDDELQRYLNFLDTAPAQRFYAIVTQSIALATDHAMTKLGTSFIRHLQAIGI